MNMNENAAQIYNQGYYYYSGTNGYPKDFHKAYEHFKKAADMGFSDALNYLGIFHEYGIVVPKQEEKAAFYYLSAFKADKDNITVLYNVGRIYYNGIGLEKNIESAENFLELAIRGCLYHNNNKTHPLFPNICYLLGCLSMEHKKDNRTAYTHFATAARYGNIPEAWHNLGWLSENGILPDGYPREEIKEFTKVKLALSYYENAAKLGYIQSMERLIHLYSKLSLQLPSLKKDFLEKAAMWAKKAASLGSVSAKKSLRMLNISGF